MKDDLSKISSEMAFRKADGLPPGFRLKNVIREIKEHGLAISETGERLETPMVKVPDGLKLAEAEARGAAWRFIDKV